MARPGALRWIVERRLVLTAAAAASIPIAVCAIRAVSDRWVPLGDTAYTAVNALDVFSGHTPLVGQWSSGATAAVDQPAYSPGPLLFWMLAVPARLPEASLMIVTIAIVNVASVAGALALARRRGGLGLMLAVAIAIPLMLASLPGEVHADIWNSSAPLLPLVLLVFLAWSLAAGEYRLLPLTVLVASFLVQSHLTFAAPAVGVTAVGVIGLVLTRRPPLPWVLAAVAVLLVCWSAPLVEQAKERPGNLVLLGRAAFADEPTAGIDTGWHAVVRTVGVRPWWLQDPDDPVQRARQLRRDPGALATVTAILILAGLVAAAIAGWRRRRFDVLTAAALALVLCAALAQVAASTPTATYDTLGYTLRWSSPAGMFVWLALGWAAGAPPPPRPAGDRGRAGRHHRRGDRRERGRGAAARSVRADEDDRRPAEGGAAGARVGARGRPHQPPDDLPRVHAPGGHRLRAAQRRPRRRRAVDRDRHGQALQPRERQSAHPRRGRPPVRPRQHARQRADTGSVRGVRSPRVASSREAGRIVAIPAIAIRATREMIHPAVKLAGS
jgi:hypothetical protein